MYTLRKSEILCLAQKKRTKWPSFLNYIKKYEYLNIEMNTKQFRMNESKLETSFGWAEQMF